MGFEKKQTSNSYAIYLIELVEIEIKSEVSKCREAVRIIEKTIGKTSNDLRDSKEQRRIYSEIE